MDASYPPEILALLDSLDNARQRLRREIERTKRLLRQTEEYIRTDEKTIQPFITPYLRQG